MPTLEFTVRPILDSTGPEELVRTETHKVKAITIIAVPCGDTSAIGSTLLQEAMAVLGTPIVKHKKHETESYTLYGERDEACRLPMLGASAAAAGFGCIIAKDHGTGAVVGTITFRAVSEKTEGDTYVELVMLRCVPEGMGIGSALLSALKTLCLERISGELYFVAYALRDARPFVRQPVSIL